MRRMDEKTGKTKRETGKTKSVYRGPMGPNGKPWDGIHRGVRPGPGQEQRLAQLLSDLKARGLLENDPRRRVAGPALQRVVRNPRLGASGALGGLLAELLNPDPVGEGSELDLGNRPAPRVAGTEVRAHRVRKRPSMSKIPL